MKEVVNGGYNVHPVPPPNSEIKERIRKRYENERIKYRIPRLYLSLISFICNIIVGIRIIIYLK